MSLKQVLVLFLCGVAVGLRVETPIFLRLRVSKGLRLEVLESKRVKEGCILLRR